MYVYCVVPRTHINLLWIFLTDDHSRVKLQFIPGEDGSDYINANFIDVSYSSTQIH